MSLSNRNPIDLLHAEARFKPHVRQWIDNLPDMTPEDITMLKGALKWQKQALLSMKEQVADGEAIDRATAIADLMGPIVDS